MDRASGESCIKATPRGAAPRRGLHRDAPGPLRGLGRPAAPCAPDFGAVPQNKTIGKRSRRPSEALLWPPRIGCPASPGEGPWEYLGKLRPPGTPHTRTLDGPPNGLTRLARAGSHLHSGTQKNRWEDSATTRTFAGPRSARRRPPGPSRGQEPVSVSGLERGQAQKRLGRPAFAKDCGPARPVSLSSQTAHGPSTTTSGDLQIPGGISDNRDPRGPAAEPMARSPILHVLLGPHLWGGTEKNWVTGRARRPDRAQDGVRARDPLSRDSSVILVGPAGERAPASAGRPSSGARYASPERPPTFPVSAHPTSANR